MDIAIIGSGNVGKALAGAATRAGHSVTVASAQPEHAEEAARSAGARAANSSREAVTGVEAVVLAVPGTRPGRCDRGVEAGPRREDRYRCHQPDEPG